MCQLRKWHRRAAARQFYHYNRRVTKEDTMQVFDSVDLLVDTYEKYLTEQGLPYVSADEQDLSELTTDQVRWIESFQQLWDLAT